MKNHCTENFCTWTQIHASVGRVNHQNNTVWKHQCKKKKERKKKFIRKLSKSNMTQILNFATMKLRERERERGTFCKVNLVKPYSFFRNPECYMTIFKYNHTEEKKESWKCRWTLRALNIGWEWSLFMLHHLTVSSTFLLYCTDHWALVWVQNKHFFFFAFIAIPTFFSNVNMLLDV